MKNSWVDFQAVHVFFFTGENLQGALTGSPVSWEHFFHSLMLYHENLRRDLPSADPGHYRHPPLRGITHRELDGLSAFLQLLTTIISWVCDRQGYLSASDIFKVKAGWGGSCVLLTSVYVCYQSENGRLALCEHPQWTPVVVMLGLLQCSVPPILKGELLRSLAAFGKSPEIAASLWQSLEYTQVSWEALMAEESNLGSLTVSLRVLSFYCICLLQILQTVRAPGQRQAAGIEVELSLFSLIPTILCYCCLIKQGCRSYLERAVVCAGCSRWGQAIYQCYIVIITRALDDGQNVLAKHQPFGTIWMFYSHNLSRLIV